jgi:hypothetical protein
MTGSAGSPASTASLPAESGDADFGSGASEGSFAAPPSGTGGSGAPAPLPPSSDPSEPGSTTTPTQPQPGSGLLTAGAWDDNLNFERFSEYRSELLQNDLHGAIPTTDAEHADAHELYSAVRGARAKLDVALVIDTTGSMGDEISYLQTEFLALTEAIESAYPNAEQRWALVAYKDQGDSYVVQSAEFQTSASAFRIDLGGIFASGGGDFPEAPDAALAATAELGWRADDTVARLAFWVADAPHHDQNAEAMADAIRDNQALDVHVYPVASSGIDEITELTMRSAAQLTGGRYLFLTDDSGIGGDHKEPTIPCYFVTRLDDAILRMVDIELSGEYREPAADEIIRTGGNPQDGACTLESGSVLQAF